jgi:hypothetical protein
MFLFVPVLMRTLHTPVGTLFSIVHNFVLIESNGFVLPCYVPCNFLAYTRNGYGRGYICADSPHEILAQDD